MTKSADNSKRLRATATFLKNSGDLGKVSGTHATAMDIALDVQRGLQVFAVDLGADASSAESTLGKSLKFLDDVTSIAHYLWIGTRAASTGKLSWDSIEDDKKKSVKKLWGKVRDAPGAVVETEKLNKELIKRHKAQIKLLDRDLAAMQKHVLHLIALSKL